MNNLSFEKQAQTKAAFINNRHKNVQTLDISPAEKEAALLTLYDNGIIHDCNQTAAKLLNCSPNELIGQPVGRFLPELAGINLVQGSRANPHLRFLSRIGRLFDVVTQRGKPFIGHLFFNDVENHGQHFLIVIIDPIKQ